MNYASTVVDGFGRPATQRFLILNNQPRHGRCPPSVVTPTKRFVYVLRSINNRDRYYTGVTSDVRKRLCTHNAGECIHTVRNRPWELDVVIAFRDETRALAFERYLKSGSGCAFAERYLR
jgi:putative endonuclease